MYGRGPPDLNICLSTLFTFDTLWGHLLIGLRNKAFCFKKVSYMLLYEKKEKCTACIFFLSNQAFSPLGMLFEICQKYHKKVA